MLAFTSRSLSTGLKLRLPPTPLPVLDIQTLNEQARPD
ncbi:hypothetical protein PAMC26577_10590 [Caballeronia sordidicola]|uniref:Uncharacterized protein n=1 Tax=Caballeronia sordidicola TaxID=196367 RepID=A0A242MYJ8_CABSO|nr:hypothetical protein PAMC26577_10590 [Caballeronia sordidicola]